MKDEQLFYDVSRYSKNTARHCTVTITGYGSVPTDDELDRIEQEIRRRQYETATLKGMFGSGITI
jgi:hypothetical protein